MQSPDNVPVIAGSMQAVDGNGKQPADSMQPVKGNQKAVKWSNESDFQNCRNYRNTTSQPN